MVKPPRTMQPEAVDLEKAGRAAGKAFQDDSFRNYMVRKIDMQRKQFGLELPPDPREEEEFLEETTLQTTAQHNQLPPPPPSPILSPNNSSPGKKRKHNKGVTFAAGVKEGDDSTTTASSSRRNSKKKKRNKGAINSIVNRLKRRHGRGHRSSTSSKRRRSNRQEEKGEPPPPQQQEDFATLENSEKENKSQALNGENDIHHKQPASSQIQPTVDEDPGEPTSTHASSRAVPYGLSPIHREEQAVETSSSFPMAEDDDEDDDEADRILGNRKHNGKQVQRQQPPQTNATTRLRQSPQMRRERPDLFFLGIVVMVNGYTNPDTETLQRLLHKHGGDLEKYETSRITHIIAEHLSTAKANIYKKMRRPIPVVHPKWVTDCVAEMRLLPHGAYLIEEVKNNEVTSVKNFFTAANPNTKGADLARGRMGSKDDDTSHQQATEDQCSSTVRLAEVKTHNEMASQGSKKATSQPDTDEGVSFQKAEFSDTTVPKEDDPASTNEPQDHTLSSCPSDEAQPPIQNTATSSSADTNVAVDPTMAKAQPQPVNQLVAVSGKTDDKFINGQIRTTGTDPNFLESFFSNSRLSFIGSYKQRIQESPKKQTGRTDYEGSKKRFVFHCDMDCFFAAVVLRNYPEYQNKPVAISHFGKPRDEQAPDDAYQPKKNSSSECATCNYEARKFGIKKGMFLGRAKELCPNLVILPYDFEGYEEVSEQVAVILQKVAAEYDGEVEQVSCDESYIELFIPCEDELCDPFRIAGEIANNVRREIAKTTRCTATVGVGENKFLSKLATDRAKPNGSFVVRNHTELLRSMKLKDLHGIGYKTAPKLAGEGLFSVQDVWDLGESGENELSRILGPGLGKKISAFCKGEDDRPVKAAERKTIGAQCYYGVRFDGQYGVDYMIEGLAKEIKKRMEGVGVRGSRVTLKMKQRKAGAKAPPKFLGHGSCHNLSKSLDVSAGPTRDWRVISEIGKILCAEMNVPKDDIRGMGMVLSKLDTTSKEVTKDGKSNQSITNWFSSRSNQELSSTKPAASSKVDAEETNKEDGLADGSPPFLSPVVDNNTAGATLSTQNPSFSQIDPSILQQLPQDIRNELEGRTDELPRPENMEDKADGQKDDGVDSPCEIEILSQNSVEENEDHGRLQDPNDSPTRSEHSLGDVVLPPMSQIHLSQVEHLPSPMRRQINTKIANHSGAADNAKKASKNGIARASTATGNKRQRQVSVKRMLKLAAFKSDKAASQGGDGNNSISVKELECLPLELQLQLANNDNCLLGNFTPANHKRGRTSLTSRKPSSTGAPSRKPSTTRVQPPNNSTRAAPSSKARRSLQMEAEDLTASGPMKEAPSTGFPSEGHSDQRDVSEENSKSEFEAGPSDFFQDNVAPLALFMDENLAAAGEALDQVTDFLCLCVRERRLHDAVLLLRNIKNRGDLWSSLSYGHLCLAVDEECDQVEGHRLDWEGLGL